MDTFVSECFLTPGNYTLPNSICWYGVSVPKILQEETGTLLKQFMEHISTTTKYSCFVEDKKNPENHITPWWCLVHKIPRTKKNTMRFSETVYDINKNSVHISVQFRKECCDEGPQLLLSVMKFLERKAHEKNALKMIKSLPLLPLQSWQQQELAFSSTTKTYSLNETTVSVATEEL